MTIEISYQEWQHKQLTKSVMVEIRTEGEEQLDQTAIEAAIQKVLEKCCYSRLD